MNDGRKLDLDQVLAEYLAEGPGSAPDRVLYGALDQVATAHQRRPLVPAWRPRVSTAFRLALAAALLAGLVGAGALYFGSQPLVPVPTAPASPTPKPMNLVWISDGVGSGGVPEAYGRRIEADLGVSVEVNSFWTPDLTIKGVLEYLQGTSNGGILVTAGSGRAKIADFIPDADVIVFSGSPDRSETAGHPSGTGCSVRFEPNPTNDPVTEAGAEAWQQYEADIVAVVDEIFKIRDGRPVILRTHDWYLPWGPLATWTSLDRVDACVKEWHEFSNAIHRAAAQRNVPVAGYYAAFSGPDGKTPLPSAWTWNDVQPSAAGAEALAGVMADLGYDLVAPPGG